MSKNDRKAGWWSTAETAQYLGVDEKTLRELRRALPPEHPNTPWVDLGGKRPTYRWKADLIDAWFKEATSWRTSRSGRAATGRSAGKTQTGAAGRAHSPRSEPPKRSSSTSKRPLAGVTGGSLVTLVKSLSSE